MKLIRYFFSIPFSPKSEWKKAMKEIDDSSSIKEDAIFLFMLLSTLLILDSYLMDLHSGQKYFSFESVFIQYFYLVVTTILVVIGIRLFGGKHNINKIEVSKLFLIVVLGSGFWVFIWGLLQAYVFPDFYYYGFLARVLISLLSAAISSVFVVAGLMECAETNFKSKLLTENASLIITIAAITVSVGLLFDFVIIRVIYRLMYMF